jgi:hypothetical protein
VSDNLSRVGVEFTGSAVGAIGAARQTAQAIDKVKVSAAGSSAPLRGMQSDLGRVERGALAGSGAFKGLGRSVAFASTAFIGAAGLVEVIKKSIDVVLESQTSIAHLDQAIRNAHASVTALTPVLEAHAAAARQLGFEDNDTRDAEAKLVTAFGATKKALDELSTAQDLARASNIPLGDAARQLILLQEGNARAAKQFGLSLPDLTAKQWAQKAAVDGLNLAQEKGKTLYDELLPRIKDQAEAYANTPAGKIAEFHAQVTHLEESIGTGLLPVVDKYLTRIDDWLAKGKNQERVTKDVRAVVDELAGVLDDAKKATQEFLKYADPVVHAIGGWKPVIEGLIGLKLASEIAGWTSGFGRLAAALSGKGGATEGINGFKGALLNLIGNPVVAGGLAAWLYGQIKGDAKATKDFAVPGSSDKHVELKDGQFTEVTHTAGRGSSAFKRTPISAAQAATLTGGATTSSSVPAGTIGGSVGALTGTSSSYGYQQLKSLWVQAGGSILDADVMASIALAESGGRVGAIGGPNSNGTFDYGLWQINSSHGYDTQSLLHNPLYNARAAVSIFNSQGLQAWSTYNNGAYEKFLHSNIQGKSAGSTASPFGPSTQTGGSGGGKTAPAKPKFVGATAATIISAQGGITAMLRGLPATLDPVEKNAIAHIKAIQDALHVHMSAADLAKDKVELTKWGKVLHDEIGKNTKVVAAAAAALNKVFDQALTLDVSHVLRGFDESFSQQMHTFDTETSRKLRDMQTAFSRQQQAFDQETQRGLQGFVVAQTPEEKALADFVAKRGADDLAKSRADQLANASTDDERAQLALGFSLDDQQAALQDAADASRVAQDAKTAADQQAYQDQRDAAKQAAQDKESDAEQAYQDQRDQQKQALQDINDDQRTALQNNLDDWTTWLESKKKSYSDFLTWLRSQGLDTSGLVNPGGGGGGAVSFATPDRLPSNRTGALIPFAAGGRVPGQFIGRQDTVLARLTPGETVLSRGLTSALEQMVLGAGGGGTRPIVVSIQIDGREIAQATAQPMSDEQARQIGYTIPRG